MSIGRLVAFAAAILCLWLPTSARAADRVLVADVVSDPTLALDAAGASLLIDGMLSATPERTPVPARERRLARRALEATAGSAQQPPALQELMASLEVQHGFVAAMRQQKPFWVIEGEARSAGADPVTIRAYAAIGDVHGLAFATAEQLAPALGLKFTPTPAVTQGQVRPFAQASQAADLQNFGAAADALRGIDATDVAAIPAGSVLVTAVSRAPTVGTADRVHLMSAAGHSAQAVELASSALEKGDLSAEEKAEVQAAKAGAYIDAGKLDEAEIALGNVSGSRAVGAVAVNSARLAVARGEPPEVAAKKLRLGLSETTPDEQLQRPLAYVARAKPGSLDIETERRALAAAKRVKLGRPALASRVGARALRSGVEPADAVELVKIGDLPQSEIGKLRPKVQKLAAGGSKAARALDVGLKARERAAQRLALGVPRPPDDPAMRALVASIQRLLPRFEGIAEGRYGVVALAGLALPTDIYMPRRLRDKTLEEAVHLALIGDPIFLQADLLADATLPAKNGALDVEQVSSSQLAALAAKGNAEALVVWGGTTEGPDARVHLYLYDVALDEVLAISDTVPGGETKLVVWNKPLLILCTIAILWIAYATLWVGPVNVRLHGDIDTQDTALCVAITRSDKPVDIGKASSFHKRESHRDPKVRRYEANRIGMRVLFPRVRPGKYFAHLYGTYKREGAVYALEGDHLVQPFTARFRATAYVNFELEPPEAVFRITVMDSTEPVPECPVWLDNNSDRPTLTDHEGRCRIPTQKGPHVIHVGGQDVPIEKPYRVVANKTYEVVVDLEWERRVDQVSRVLQRDRNDTVVQAQARQMEHEVPLGDEADLAGGAAAAAPAKPAGAGISVPGVGQDGPLNPSTDPARPSGDSIRLSDVEDGVGGATLMTPSAGVPAPMANVPSGSGPIQSTSAAQARYRRVKELGRGAMGVVFKGEDTDLGREVAIKIISKEISGNQKVVDRFLEEARALAALNHPNIVTIHDRGQDGDEIFLVMEFVEGTTLQDLIDTHKRFDVARACYITDQICAALQYAHQKRVIHRDIKPENIFVSGDGLVKVGDFGLARTIAEAQITKTAVQGTPLYMSPEQIVGRGIDFRADLYSVGCTLFELLTGVPPFTTGEILYHHVHTPPPRVSDLVQGVPPALEAIVAQLLEKDKDRRFPSAAHVQQALRHVAQQFQAQQPRV